MGSFLSVASLLSASARAGDDTVLSVDIRYHHMHPPVIVILHKSDFMIFSAVLYQAGRIVLVQRGF
jgi:hypothetical protein